MFCNLKLGYIYILETPIQYYIYTENFFWMSASIRRPGRYLRPGPENEHGDERPGYWSRYEARPAYRFERPDISGRRQGSVRSRSDDALGGVGLGDSDQCDVVRSPPGTQRRLGDALLHACQVVCNFDHFKSSRCRLIPIRTAFAAFFGNRPLHPGHVGRPARPSPGRTWSQ